MLIYIYIFTHTQKSLRNTRQNFFPWHGFQSVTFTLTFSTFEASLNCYKLNFLLTPRKEHLQAADIRHSPSSLFSPMSSPEIFLRLTQRKGALQESHKQHLGHSPSLTLWVCCLQTRSLYPLETLQNILPYTTHKVWWHYTLHYTFRPNITTPRWAKNLQELYQTIKLPCQLAPELNSQRHFSIPINHKRPRLRSWCTLQNHFICTADLSQIRAAITPCPAKELAGEEGWKADNSMGLVDGL